MIIWSPYHMLILIYILIEDRERKKGTFLFFYMWPHILFIYITCQRPSFSIQLEQQQQHFFWTHRRHSFALTMPIKR